MTRLSLDLETTSTVDLRKVGAYAYAEHTDTKILAAAWAVDDGPVEGWHIGMGYGQEPWRDLITLLGDPDVEIHAWNANFERRILEADLAVAPVLERYHCSMAQASYWGLPLGLDEAAKALNAQHKKDAPGRRLMLKLSKPRSRMGLVPTWWHEDEPALLDQLLDYCKQDVRTERSISMELPVLPERERKVYLLDQEINDRGIKLDHPLVLDMQRLVDYELAVLNYELTTLTNGAVTSANQVAKIVQWCQDHGYKAVTSLAKDQLEIYLNGQYVAEGTDAFRVLEIRQEAAKSSTAKLRSMMNYRCRDGRIKGMFQYYGAFRTGRWSGRGPQPQNYPRPVIKSVEKFISQVRWADPEGLSLVWDRPLDAVSSALRGCFIAEQDHEIAAVDFSQIEARVLAWLADERKVLATFSAGADVYATAAAGIFNVPAYGVTDDQRQIGKVVVLACGYQGGVGAFQSMAKNYGVVVPDERAKDIVDNWRQDHPHIVDLWYRVQALVEEVISHNSSSVRMLAVAGGKADLKARMWQGHLIVRLPSGRDLCYRGAGMEPHEEHPWEPGKLCPSYMGVDQYTHQWNRIFTYGGKMVENIVQALARDLMVDAMLALDAKGWEIIGTVHDEILMETSISISNLTASAGFREGRAKFLEGFVCDAAGSHGDSAVPKWSAGLELAAGCKISGRYGK